MHVSAPLQALPSEQLDPALTGVWVTPVAGLHASVVHGLLSFNVGGVPATQVPALHVSAPLQALLSVQDVPLGAAGLVHAPVPALQLPATWHASEATHTTGFAPTQAPD